LGIILLTASGCTFSHVDPQKTVTISGRALTESGSPLANATVHLYKEPDVGEVIVGSVLALGSLGGVCLFPGAPAICNKGRTAKTGADGRYRFTMKGSDTQGLIGDASTLDLVFADPKGGQRATSTTLRFKVQQEATVLPDARLWGGQLAVRQTVAGGQKKLAFSWSSLPAAYGTGAKYDVRLLDPTKGSALWSQPAPSTSVRIDARVLEDRAADAAVTARSKLAGADAVYLSARKQLSPSAGAPPSRHKPCSAVTGTTKLATVKQTVCVATDGDLSSPAQLTASNGAIATGLVVDLGTARPVSLVVARNLTAAVTVEVSTDGTSFHAVGTAPGQFDILAPPGRGGAVFVRVGATGGTSETAVSEVSVWS
jgi:hypothetical protein